MGVMNVREYHPILRKNSIASALVEQIHKNFNYVIKSSSENGYNATVTTEITTFDSDSILADYQEKLDKYLASADASYQWLPETIREIFRNSSEQHQ